MVYRFGSILVDGDWRTAYRNDARLPLTDKEFDVLHVLVKSPDCWWRTIC
jgi:DNA-binding response OmpR family regulator